MAAAASWGPTATCTACPSRRLEYGARGGRRRSVRAHRAGVDGGGAHGGYKYHGGLPRARTTASTAFDIARRPTAVNCPPRSTRSQPEDEPFNRGKYKWGGGCRERPCVPSASDSCRVLKIDCRRGTVELSQALDDGKKINSRAVVLGGDGGIWCVPCDAAHACRIDPAFGRLRASSGRCRPNGQVPGRLR